MNRSSLGKFYAIARSSIELYGRFLIANCKNKNVLECGCGTGIDSIFLGHNYAKKVIGVDISKALIQSAQTNIEAERLTGVISLVGDVEALQFHDNVFDLVCGMSIMHHLHIDKALKEITRVLNLNGVAIFLEPMGHNVFINLFRKFTPALRVKNEHPLRNKDIALFKKFFYCVDFKFFYFFSFLAIPFKNTKLFPLVLEKLDCLDRKLAESIPLFGLLCWQVVIIAEGPKKCYEI